MIQKIKDWCYTKDPAYFHIAGWIVFVLILGILAV